MQRLPRNRLTLAFFGIALVALGLGSRRGGMPGFVVLYAGDVFWGSFFFVLGAWLRPAWTTVRLWYAATLVVELIELSQLYQAPWIQAVRSARLGGLLLGHEFLWSDVVCVALGTSLAALVDLRSARTTTSARGDRTAE